MTRTNTILLTVTATFAVKVKGVKNGIMGADKEEVTKATPNNLQS